MSARNLVHYADADTITVESRTQTGARWKPDGFWISDENDETSWSRWCTDNDYTRGANAYRVELAADANLLWLTTVADVRTFSAAYGVQSRYRPSPHAEGIDWRAVAELWSGIFITPYQWSLRLSDIGWYYSWDCASGCVWDAAAIASVAPIESDDDARCGCGDRLFCAECMAVSS